MATAPSEEREAPSGASRLREAPELIDLARAGRVDDRARAEEEQRLEEGVVPDVEQRAGEAERDELGATRRRARAPPGRGPCG